MSIHSLLQLMYLLHVWRYGLEDSWPACDLECRMPRPYFFFSLQLEAERQTLQECQQAVVLLRVGNINTTQQVSLSFSLAFFFFPSLGLPQLLAPIVFVCTKRAPERPISSRSYRSSYARVPGDVHLSLPVASLLLFQ